MRNGDQKDEERDQNKQQLLITNILLLSRLLIPFCPRYALLCRAGIAGEMKINVREAFGGCVSSN